MDPTRRPLAMLGLAVVLGAVLAATTPTLALAASPALPWSQVSATAAAKRVLADTRNLRESAAGTRTNLGQVEHARRREVLQTLLKMQNMAKYLVTQLDSGANRARTQPFYDRLLELRGKIGVRAKVTPTDLETIPAYLLTGLGRLDSSLGRLGAYYSPVAISGA